MSRRTVSSAGLLLMVLVLQTSPWGTRCSCDQEKLIKDVAVNVVSEAGNLFFTGDARLTGCRPRDCAQIQQRGHYVSGVYRIWPRSCDTCGVDVYCDLEKHGGGWTVIQRRGKYGKPMDYFDKTWRYYKFGFGNISEDFWLGNDKISQISNQDNYVLRVDMRADREWRYAQYTEFFVEPESKNYTLRIGEYSGDANDSMWWHVGQTFSTKDRDNDESQGNCAEGYRGGWWFNDCHQSHLNGLYLDGAHNHSSEGVVWISWKGEKFSLQESVMKIRPDSFR